MRDLLRWKMKMQVSGTICCQDTDQLAFVDEAEKTVSWQRGEQQNVRNAPQVDMSDESGKKLLSGGQDYIYQTDELCEALLERDMSIESQATIMIYSYTIHSQEEFTVIPFDTSETETVVGVERA